MPRITFWFEFASTYSYLSALRIGAEAASRGIGVQRSYADTHWEGEGG